MRDLPDGHPGHGDRTRAELAADANNASLTLEELVVRPRLGQSLWMSLLIGTLALGCVDSSPTAPKWDNSAGPVSTGSLSRPVPILKAFSDEAPVPGSMGATAPGDDFLGGVSTAAAGFSYMRILWQNTTTGERSLWEMNGTSYRSAEMLPTVATEWSIAGAGDFNGDGNADIVWQNLTTGDRSIWFMSGNGYKSAAMLPKVPTQWSIAGVGDFNHDLSPDLVWQNLTTGDRSIWFMRGSTYQSAVMLPRVSTEWQIVAVGDFYRTGALWVSPDLLWQRPGTGQLVIWIMDGGTWTNEFLSGIWVPSAWRVAAAGDFDGDGYVDLVWQNVNTGERSIWLMQGAYRKGAVMLPTVPIQWSIAGAMPGWPPPLFPPGSLQLDAAPVSATQINLSWRNFTPPLSPFTEFRVEQCVGFGCTGYVEIAVLPPNSTSLNVTGLSPSTMYRFRVRGNSAVGYYDYSNIVTPTTPAG